MRSKRHREIRPVTDFALLSDVWRTRESVAILADVDALRRMHKEGSLGGHRMPEDAHPQAERGGADLYHYFTLGMSLNYQRNSYALWQAATAAFLDKDGKHLFDPQCVVGMSSEAVRALLVHFRVALQPQRHTDIWQRICEAICGLLDGDMRQLFRTKDADVPAILHFVQVTHKRAFPYLSGPKIANYWLYVMDQYTDANLRNKHALSVAPDTHVIQASIQLGLVPPSIRESATVATVVSERWKEVLVGTGIAPIDVHTPLWLWSRAGFPVIIRSP